MLIPASDCRFENVSCAVPGSRFNDSHWSSNQAASDGFSSGQGHALASSDMKKADVVSHFPSLFPGWVLPLISMPCIFKVAQGVWKLKQCTL